MECLKRIREFVRKYSRAIIFTAVLQILLFFCFNSNLINISADDPYQVNIVTLLTCILSILCLALVTISIYFFRLNKELRRKEALSQNAIKAANILVITFLEDGIILEFNNNAEDKLGYKSENIVKTHRIFDLLPAKEQLKLRTLLDEVNDVNTEKHFELCIHTQKGDSLYLLSHLHILDHDNIKVYELMGIDITDRVTSEHELFVKHEELTAVYEELAASEEELKDQLDELIKQKIMLQEKDERHNLVIEASNIGIWEKDSEAGTSFYADKWYEIFGLDKNDVAGREDDVYKTLILPEDYPKLRRCFDKHIAEKTPQFECEYRIKTPDGQIKWIHSVGKALWDFDGSIIKMAGADTDITAKKEIEERINRLAYYDTLTGLPNSSSLTERFEAMKNNGVKTIALIYIDMDNFKLINDFYGHIIGDKVMVEVSTRLKRFCSEKIHISRLGGDEFALLVPDTNDEELLSFVGNLINYLEAIIQLEDYNLSLGANVGIARYPEDGDYVDVLLRNADTAMYRATEKKSKYLFFKPGMNDEITERLDIRNHIKLGLIKNEFTLYYQPQYRSSDKKIMGFEALCRWNNEKLGSVPPSKFIPIAEESKLIIPLGDWILEEAIKFLRKLHNMGYEHLIMSVNISVVQLLQKNFSEKVLKLIESYNIPPSCVELEITESGMMESVELVLENIKLLRDHGVRIALDDFGTGYSSLNYLTELPLDTLKLDKSFVDNIGGKKEKSLLTGSIVEIGRRLGLSIVAEGVETEDQFRYLARKRCERIQGYYFSEPIPEELVIKLMD